MLLPGALEVDITSALELYREQGFASLGRVFSEAWLAKLRERADDIMLGRVVHEGMFFQHDAPTGRYEDLTHGEGWVGPSLSYRKLEKLEKDDRFRLHIENPLFERIARAVIPGDVAIYRAVLFNKAKEGSSEIPWHQDAGRFWGLDRDPELQVWTALDDAPVGAGCVELLPGTHREGRATPLGGVVPAVLIERAQADAQAVPAPAVAGEVLLIHNHVWHRSGANTSGRPRRAVTICYMSAQTRCLRTRRPPRSFVRVFGA